MIFQSFLESLPVEFISFSSPTEPDHSSPYYQFFWNSDPANRTTLHFAIPNQTLEVSEPSDAMVCILFQSTDLAEIKGKFSSDNQFAIPASPFISSILNYLVQFQHEPRSKKLTNLLSCNLTMLLVYLLEHLNPVHEPMYPNVQPNKVSEMVINQALNHSVRFMTRHMINPELSLHDIANAVGYHPNYFCYEFSRNFSLSPMRFLKKMRVEKALHLLEETDYSIRTICTNVGIISPKQICDMVKSTTGMTPTQFRRSKRLTGFQQGGASWPKSYLSADQPVGMYFQH